MLWSCANVTDHLGPNACQSFTSPVPLSSYVEWLSWCLVARLAHAASLRLIDVIRRSQLGSGIWVFTDVLSSNQHSVKPWFDGRLNFTPPVKDLGPEGFPLVGGRLDYVDNRPVAAVVYRRRLHIINLFNSPAAEHAADRLPGSEVRGGFNIVHWTKLRLSYWAVSGLSAADLRNFAQLVSEEDSPAAEPGG